MKNSNKEGFSYTYSAREQAEIRSIREKYTAQTEQEDKMARLRRLDSRVTQKAQSVSLVFGVIGTLILGLGMSLFMSELGDLMNLSRELSLILGIAIGVIGGLSASLAYPIYEQIIKRERRKIAPEVLRLTDELMGGSAGASPNPPTPISADKD